MKLEKISEITSLLPTQDAQTKYCLLRSCLSLPKIMFTLRTVNTLSHPHFLAEFDRLTREALTLTGILGTPLPPAQWDQSKLPISMGSLCLRAALDVTVTHPLQNLTRAGAAPLDTGHDTLDRKRPPCLPLLPPPPAWICCSSAQPHPGPPSL